MFGKARYQADETWRSSDGSTFKPGLHYWVGGNSKLYGAALFRLREADFHAVRHVDGVAPEWPLKYDVFEPYYTQAESLYRVHGARGEDPTEPPASAPLSQAADSPRAAHRGTRRRSDEGRAASVSSADGRMDRGGQANGVIAPDSPCLRCDPFDGYPSLTNGKADAQIVCHRSRRSRRIRTSR